MKKLKLTICLCCVLLAAGINSCKKDNQLLPASMSGLALAQLSSNEKVQTKEVLDWYATNMQATGLQPRWDKATQTVYNGNHVIQVPTSKDAALFFTKIKGVLNVYAYKWLNKDKVAKTFTGNIFYYSYRDNTATGSVYDKSKLIKSKSVDVASFSSSSMSSLPLPTPSSGGTVKPPFSMSGSKSLVSVNGARTLAAGFTVFDWLTCILGGNTWVGFYTGCRTQNSWWGDVLNAIGDALGDVFGGGGGDGDGNGDGNGNNSESYTSADGSTTSVSDGGIYFTGSDGTSTSITNVTLEGGGGSMAWVTVNLPCNTPAPTSPGGRAPINNDPPIDGDPSSGPCGTVAEWTPVADLAPTSVFGATYNLSNAQVYWLSQNNTVFISLNNYVNTSGLSVQGNADFLNFATTYLMQNSNISMSQFQNYFMVQNEGLDGPDDFDQSYWDDPNLNIQTQPLPTFQNFNTNYPNLPAEQVYQLIGGQILTNHQNQPASYVNACALRVSRALNYSGVTIPVIAGTQKGADGKNYFLSAKNLDAWMKKTFGAPSHNFTASQGGAKGANFPALLNGLQGIYLMISSNPAWASGHADLFNNNTCDMGCHFDGPINYIDFWVLP